MGCGRPKARVLGHRKKGVAYAKADTHWANLVTSATWAYNWFSDEHFWDRNSPNLSRDYIPMLHDMHLHDHVRDWDKNIQAARSRDRYEILAFNEPNMPDQFALSPQDAKNAYLRHMEPYACQGFRLGAPAVSNSDKPGQGLAWLAEFMVLCNSCTIDFVPIHIYLHANNMAGWKRAVESARMVARGKPLWITEFHAAGNEDEVERFLREFIPWLDAQQYVERYAYRVADKGWAMDGPLLIADNGRELSRTGRVYNSL
ncbi:hypothetical protein EJ08DRAFT_600368 [Tothia fuscella]|uniref:Asl1-like glycosyl hydrolase catalytic domain-containing protein n=1 Tax=Tothia fuscella TaxID=1048955 RepID=A0A9P4TS21_9PEZI|nr:hypothetical protein EJ08DRAFT_600368 [Tothia fuscella]